MSLGLFACPFLFRLLKAWTTLVAVLRALECVRKGSPTGGRTSGEPKFLSNLPTCPSFWLGRSLALPKGIFRTPSRKIGSFAAEAASCNPIAAIIHRCRYRAIFFRGPTPAKSKGLKPNEKAGEVGLRRKLRRGVSANCGSAMREFWSIPFARHSSQLKLPNLS